VCARVCVHGRYYASTPYYMVVSDKEGRDLLLQGVDTFSIKRAARSKNRELLLRLLRRWKMAVRIQKQIRSQGRLQTQIVNAQAMIDTLQEERKELESVEGMAQLLAALDPDQHEAAMLKLLEQLEVRGCACSVVALVHGALRRGGVGFGGRGSTMPL